MPFANNQTSNNAQGLLLAGISASATSLILQSGQGAMFPSVFPFYIKAENYDTALNNYRVLKREIMKVTNRVGDTLTIVRSSGTCPPDYATNTPGTTAFSFSGGDTIVQTLPAEQIKDISDELTRLETAKLDISALQANSKIFGSSATGNDSYVITLSPAPAALTVGMVVYFKADVANTGPATLNVNGLGAKNILKQHDLALVDGDIEAGAIVQVGYDGTQWQMMSQVANIPTTDIHGQTLKGAPIGADEILISDSEASWANKKTTLDKILAPIGGNGSDGALSISSGTTTIPFNSNGYIEKNYTTVSISGTATLTFSGPLTNGSIAYIKCQRFVMTGGTISVAGMGGAGGAGGNNANASPGNQGFNVLKTNTTNFGGGGTVSGVVGAGGTGIGHFGGYLQGYCGAGGGGASGASSGAVNGGNGGGLIIIEAREYYNASSGIITAAGNGGTSSASSSDGAGAGGGGGGAIFIICPNIVSNAVTKNVNGGNGGNAFAINFNSYRGGGGGASYSNGGAGGTAGVAGTAGTSNAYGSGGTGGSGAAGGTPTGGGGGGGAGFYKVN